MSKLNTRSPTDEFLKGLTRENPVFVQVLGMCPVLAVTNSAINGLTMGLATTFVLLMSNALVSILRNFIPRQVRIAVYILIIATFVTVVDYLIAAVSVDLHRSLGAFISLIVANCFILGRAEAFASKNTFGRSVLDALGMGAGFTLALLCMGGLREILGNGSFFGLAVFPGQFQPWVVMILPSGGFFTLAFWLLAINRVKTSKERRLLEAQQKAQISQGAP